MGADLQTSIRKRLIFSTAVVGTTFVLAAIALKLLPIPFAWIGFFFATACFVVASQATEYLRFPLVIAASLPLALAFGEIYFSLAGRAEVSHEVEGLFEPEPLLGWQLKPSSKVRARATVPGEVIYDVVYSTDSDRRRISPPDRGDDVIGCLLFFSDSFTFGQGVDDSSAFP